MRFTLSVFLCASPPAASAQARQTVLTKADAVRLGLTPRSARSSASLFHVVLSDVLTFIAPSGAIRG